MFVSSKWLKLVNSERSTYYRCAVKLKLDKEKKEAHTQGEDVGAPWPGHVVLLDGLIERGLAQQQEAEANPHNQQPGHGKGESAGQNTVGMVGGQENRVTNVSKTCLQQT